MVVALFNFIEENDIELFQRNGFTIEVDDEVNGIYYAGINFADSDPSDILKAVKLLNERKVSFILQFDVESYSSDEAYEILKGKMEKQMQN